MTTTAEQTVPTPTPTRVAELKGEIADMDQSISDLESEISNLQLEVAFMENRRDDLETKLDAEAWERRAGDECSHDDND